MVIFNRRDSFCPLDELRHLRTKTATSFNKSPNLNCSRRTEGTSIKECCYLSTLLLYISDFQKKMADVSSASSLSYRSYYIFSDSRWLSSEIWRRLAIFGWAQTFSRSPSGFCILAPRYATSRTRIRGVWGWIIVNYPIYPFYSEFLIVYLLFCDIAIVKVMKNTIKNPITDVITIA